MTKTADIQQALREATSTQAVIAAAKAMIPGNTSVETTRDDNGTRGWRIRTMCCGTPFTGTVPMGTSARASLAGLLREALNHTETHGITAPAVRPAAYRPARCEDCGTWLTAFDLAAAAVAHLCFDCA